MKFLALQQNLNSGREAVYLIRGSDAYFRTLARKMFEDLTLGFAQEYNLAYFDYTADWDRVSLALDTPPFGAQEKVVIWRGDVRPIAERDLKKIALYHKNPTPGAILVLADEKDYFKDLINVCETVDCDRLESGELIRYLVQHVTKAGYRCDAALLKEIVLRSENDMARIEGELEKLFSYCAETKSITEQDVAKTLINSVDYDGFKLANALSEGKNDVALTVLNTLSEKGELPVGILVLLAGQYKRMFYGKISKLSDIDLAAKLKINAYAVKMARNAASKYTALELKSHMKLLHDAEFECKNGKRVADTALSESVCKLLRKNKKESL